MNKKRFFRNSLIVVICIFAIFAPGYIFGIGENEVEKDARSRFAIEKDWTCFQSINDEMAVLLFFDQKQENSIISVYKNKKGISFGYFFHRGGSDDVVNNGVLGLTIERKNNAILSMNKKGIAKIVTAVETYTIDPNEPFTIIMPDDAEYISLLDSNNNEIPFDVMSIY